MPPPAVEEEPTRTSPGPIRKPGPGGAVTPQPGPRLPPGTVLAERYRIVEWLGGGGMGEVYRADDLVLDLTVALKLLPDDLARDEARLARLLKEVRIARQVSHPNVCRVYDIEESLGRRFLTMELLEGETLASIIGRKGPFSPEEGLALARQLCAGLGAAHERGILHRDLKPSNVMIDERGLARIMDFGIAEMAEVVRGSTAREGTPFYMAPEQLAGGEVTPRSDLYALGLLLYEVFTGVRPGSEATTVEDLLSVRRASPSPPSRSVPGIDRRVERVILRCLDPDPARRPPSARVVAESLPGGATAAQAVEAAQRRADRISAFRAEAAELRRAGILRLDENEKGAIEVYHREVLSELVRHYDVDVSEQSKQLSLGMRAVALIGAVALSASVFYFFYSLWGLISIPAQVGLLSAAPVAALFATAVLASRERSGYFATIAGLFAFACFLLDVTVLWASLDLDPSPYALAALAAFAMTVAYAFGLRLLLVAGIGSIAVFIDAWISFQTGAWWSACLHRPENYLAAGAICCVLPVALRHSRLPAFPQVYRIGGLCLLFVALIFLSEAGSLSHLPLPAHRIEVGYQILGFLGGAATIWIGVVRRWKEVVYCGSAFLLILLYLRFVHWWWDWMPRSLFFLTVSLVSILILLVLRRLRGVMAAMGEVGR